MALTISNIKFDVWGTKRVSMFDLAFDSSYPAGGESLLPADARMGGVDKVLIEPKNGIAFEYDLTNQKVKAFMAAPPIVWEEQQTIAANAITLNYPAAYIFYVATADGNIAITDPAATLAANQCKPTAAFAAGVRSGLTFHSGLSGTVYVGYITQAWKEVWDNLVQSETQATAAHVATLTNQAIAIQSIRAVGGTGTNASLMLDKDDTVATLEATVNMTSTTKTLTFFATDAITSCIVTYIKKPASGFLLDRFVAEEALTAATNVLTPAYPLLIWGYGGQVPENGQVTEVMINIAGSQGAGEAKLAFNTGEVKIAGHSITTGTGMYVWGRPEEIPGIVPLECRNGVDLSAITGVKVTMIGR
jgi:hypothetical protein